MFKHCIACGYHISYPIYQPEDQPLAALALPASAEQAQNINRYPINFYACANCGHIFNVAFDINHVPYEGNSNLMYNAGVGWQKYMTELVDEISHRYDLRAKTIIDIGCGDGGFLKLLQNKDLGIRCIGYEPGIEAENARRNGLEAIQDYFVPERDIQKHKPDFLICRHVIEHFETPKDFVADIAYWSNKHCIFPVLIAEVPCIDKAIENTRINDFIYEHVSNFTHFSFVHMFEESGYEILYDKLAYGDEVVVAEARPRKISRLEAIATCSETYHATIKTQIKSVQRVLERLKNQGKCIAFWGGTGKGAAFLNAFNLTTNDYPIVVDSDYQKVGKYVPGTAQKICPPEYLNEHPVDIIVITTQWRAKDIYNEITRRGITYEMVMVLVDLELHEYAGESI